jgi:restriction endonuclease Mrr
MILKFYEYFHHVLEFSKKHGKATTSEIRENVLKNTGATVEERNLVTNKGTLVVNGRLHWAIQYLFQAGALTRPAKGVYEITQIGLELLEKYPNGKVYYDNTDKLRGTAIIVHFNWVHGHHKMAKMKEHKMWLLTPEEEELI